MKIRGLKLQNTAIRDSVDLETAVISQILASTIQWRCPE